jgi:hypothetical protein
MKQIGAPFQGARDLHGTAAGAASGCSGSWARDALGVKHGDCEMKLRAAANFAVDPNAAAVNFHDVFGDGEAETGAA